MYANFFVCCIIRKYENYSRVKEKLIEARVNRDANIVDAHLIVMIVYRPRHVPHLLNIIVS